MNVGFYPKLAIDGIRKNKRLYLPFILTCIGMVMMYYIVIFLRYSEAISYMPGADTLGAMLAFGGWVIAIFAAIFMFYTNSFLVRRRKKEFGLYNILGMGKRNISIILFWETVFITIVSLCIGLIAGIALSKLAELGLVNIVSGDVTYSMEVSTEAILMAVKIFCIIFLLLYINTIRQIKSSNAIALLHSENVGEKPPKANWFLGIIGVVILAAAYYISVSIENPVSALVWFFVAVIMVIIGTYLILIAGSVLFCRILQRKKNYYYKSNHFVSVSSMVYRMKRNGAGLASICILATMVLVMISSTASLYFGSEDALRTRYPKEINIDMRMEDIDDLSEKNISDIRKKITEVTDSYGVTSDNIIDYREAYVTGLLDKNVVETDMNKTGQFNMATYSNVYQLYILLLDDYNRITGENETLESDEVMIYSYRFDYKEDTFTINGGNTFSVKKNLDKFDVSGEAAMNILPCMYIIVPSFESGLDGVINLKDYNGNRMFMLRWTYAFDTQIDSELQIELGNEIRETLRNVIIEEGYGIESSFYDSREENRTDFYGMFGSLFFLGIILSIVFVFATVLIIYYKQISEGYEDQSRFDIMQKVGMTKKEIRSSINSQLLTVFFLPLIGAGLHLTFAFPIIRKLLMMFNLNNVALFAVATVISFIAFGLFYTLIYRITSNAYYNIVSGAK